MNPQPDLLSTALLGTRVLLPIDRKSEAMADSLSRHGAEVTIAPPLRITAATDDPSLHAACRKLATETIDFTVVTTGVGFRALTELARQEQHRTAWGEDLLAQLSESKLLSRGPKPKGAIVEAGFAPAWTADSETSAEILEYLLAKDLHGAHIVVQHHGAGDTEFEQSLRAAGARVTGLTTYRWEDPLDPAKVQESVQNAARGHFDVIAFTSAPAAERWLEIARAENCLENILALHNPATTEPPTEQLSRLMIAAVGPVTAQPLIDAGFAPQSPERFRMGALIKLIVQHGGREAPKP